MVMPSFLALHCKRSWGQTKKHDPSHDDPELNAQLQARILTALVIGMLACFVCNQAVMGSALFGWAGAGANSISLALVLLVFPLVCACIAVDYYRFQRYWIRALHPTGCRHRYTTDHKGSLK